MTATTKTGASRRAVQRCVKTVAAGTDRLRVTRKRSGIVVLAYHRVGAHSDAIEIDLPTPLFGAQMAELAGRVATLDDALDTLRESCPTKNDVVVTFDDGTVDFVEEALPSLVQYQIPAVLYVATEFVDDGVAFPDRGRAISWAALRDATATGLVTIGSHTHSHALLDRCPPDVVEKELDRSIELIAENLGAAPAHFAYPKALAGNEAAAAEVARRFRSAALAGTRANRYGATDPQRLARSPIQRSDDMQWFRRKVDGGMTLEDDLRRVANRFRYAGASS